MEQISNFFNSYWAYLVPLFIGIFLAIFIKKTRIHSSDFRMLVEKEHYLRMRQFELSEDKDIASPSVIRQLLLRDDVTLRILEEVHEQPRGYRRRSLSGSDSFRLHILDSLELELKSFLRDSVESSEFPSIRDRTLKLLDEIRSEKNQLQQKEPFNDINDPEKSLLIDIFHQIDPSNNIVRQKTIQLSNIIKIKHQDLLKLQADNSKAGTWTRWGVAGTIIFGLISLVLSFISISTTSA